MESIWNLAEACMDSFNRSCRSMDIAHYQNEIVQLKNYNAQLRNNNAQLENHNAQLENHNAQLENHNAQLRNNNAQLENHNAQLRERIYELERSNNRYIDALNLSQKERQIAIDGRNARHRLLCRVRGEIDKVIHLIESEPACPEQMYGKDIANGIITRFDKVIREVAAQYPDLYLWRIDVVGGGLETINGIVPREEAFPNRTLYINTFVKESERYPDVKPESFPNPRRRSLI